MSDKKILVAFILNLAFSIIEFFGGIITNSVAIISDSVHDLGDSISILLSFILERKSKKAPDNIYTYGYNRYSVLGAVITNSILITGSILVIYNSILRIMNPVNINYNGMIVFAIFGVVINFIAAYTTHDGESLNEHAVSLHMLEDVLGWVVVLLGAIIMKFCDIKYIDPCMSIIVALFIFYSAIKNMLVVLDLFLGKVPKNINVEKIKTKLLDIDGVIDIHHIHIWSLDGDSILATMHVVTNDDNSKIKKIIREELKDENINHVTLELETDGGTCENEKCFNEKKHHVHHHH